MFYPTDDQNYGDRYGTTHDSRPDQAAYCRKITTNAVRFALRRHYCFRVDGLRIALAPKPFSLANIPLPRPKSESEGVLPFHPHPGLRQRLHGGRSPACFVSTPDRVSAPNPTRCVDAPACWATRASLPLRAAGTPSPALVPLPLHPA